MIRELVRDYAAEKLTEEEFLAKVKDIEWDHYVDDDVLGSLPTGPNTVRALTRALLDYHVSALTISKVSDIVAENHKQK